MVESLETSGSGQLNRVRESQSAAANGFGMAAPVNDTMCLLFYSALTSSYSSTQSAEHMTVFLVQFCNMIIITSFRNAMKHCTLTYIKYPMKSKHNKPQCEWKYHHAYVLAGMLLLPWLPTLLHGWQIHTLRFCSTLYCFDFFIFNVCAQLRRWGNWELIPVQLCFLLSAA